MDKVLTLDEIKKIATKVAIKHELKRVVLFGSYANGNATKKSDLDFIIDFKEDARPTYFDLFDIQDSFNDAAGRKVDVLTYGGLENSYIEIGREVLLYELQ